MSIPQIILHLKCRLIIIQCDPQQQSEPQTQQEDVYRGQQKAVFYVCLHSYCHLVAFRQNAAVTLITHFVAERRVGNMIRYKKSMFRRQSFLEGQMSRG